MAATQSSDFLTPLRPERIDALLASDFDRVLANDWLSTGAHAIEDVGGAARYDERVLLSDIGAVTKAMKSGRQ